ncbi:MAG: radical SAM protein [Pseudomonadota bacterium]
MIKKLESLKVVLVYPNTINREAFPPMGIAYLASYLYSFGVQVKIIDLNFEPDMIAYRKKLIASKPDVVGFSFTSPLANSAAKCIEICKTEFPDSIIVAGGPHPSIMPQKTMEKCPVDYVVIGEGELTFHALLKSIVGECCVSEVAGICYRSGNDEIIQTKSRNFIENLDELPQINWGLMPEIKKYLHYSDYSLPVMTSRGCPGKCSFCQPTVNTLFGRKVRFRSPAKVIQELIDLKNANLIKSFLFQDDTFTLRKSWVREFCKLAEEKELNMKWACNSRVDTITEEMLQDMRKVGLNKIAFGVESGSQRILDEIMQKGTSIKQIINVFDLCRKYHIPANAFIMLGSPNETREDIEATIRLLQRIKPNWVSCTRTVLLPHTYMFDYANEEKLSLLDDTYLDNLHYADFKSATHHINFSDDEMRQLKNKLYRKWAIATINERTILKLGLIFLTFLGTVSPFLARVVGKSLSKVIWVPPPTYS